MLHAVYESDAAACVSNLQQNAVTRLVGWSSSHTQVLGMGATCKLVQI